VLPLVSRRWARLLGGPSHAWRDVALDGPYFCESSAQGVVQRHTDPLRNAATALAWFASRPA